MAKVVKRRVYYFDEPEEGNTELVIEAVSQRLEASGIKGLSLPVPPVRPLLNLSVLSRARLS